MNPYSIVLQIGGAPDENVNYVLILYLQTTVSGGIQFLLRFRVQPYRLHPHIDENREGPENILNENILNELVFPIMVHSRNV